MNLVEIRSHVDTPKAGVDVGVNATKASVGSQSAKNEESKERKTSTLSEEVKGFALTVKESFIESLLSICEDVRPMTFLCNHS